MRFPAFLSASLALILPATGPAESYAQASPRSQAEAWNTARSLVEDLYAAVTFEADTTPDWDHVRSMFIDDAVVVLRTSRTETTIFSVDGFVADFVRFIEQANVRQTGFTERIVRMKPLIFGDIAHVLVLYEASIPGSARPPQQGVDSFQLIRRDGRWWIVSITNELPRQGLPVPPELATDTTRSTTGRAPPAGD